ncbi:hypothetical protein QBC41DRAFT_52391 [Cercophora samala]|uniref:RRM domain-containing protein n=1 Tax=Cercophora samala TaxID=330535 RepID=A0AA39ZN58_9PEZI|nr:hypothetical protein QBC41DRAFT_52391 [Cercophora samala]
MSRNQMHHQNLVLVTVPPGSVTGLYYITIGNFSHSTTWKDLKAFVSQVCEVDYCLTYDPTAGFVRVKGLDNFEKAYKFLDGNTLHYRCLQADDRNRDSPTVVKLPPNDYHAILLLKDQQRGRVVDDPSATQPAPDPYYTTYPTNPNPADMRRNSECTSPIQYTTSPNWPAYPAYTTTATQEYPPIPTSNPPTLYQDLSPPQPSFPIPNPTAYPLTTAETYYPSPNNNNTSNAEYYPNPPPSNQDYSPAYYPPTNTTNTTTTTTTPTTATITSLTSTDFGSLSFPPTSDLILLENRKIILLGLDKRRLDQPFVSSLLNTFCPAGYGAAIEQIEIPISSKSQKPKGTAFITFGEGVVGGLRRGGKKVIWW